MASIEVGNRSSFDGSTLFPDSWYQMGEAILRCLRSRGKFTYHCSDPIIFLSLFQLIEMLIQVINFFEFEYLLASKIESCEPAFNQMSN